ncbi:Rv3235 family protein [Kineococcus esterisolvens]|uniref:Rv3235 family protein n=1 Tax=unclassified Kineococcus TaxID=2621656 RepID=UPI003D7D214E
MPATAALLVDEPTAAPVRPAAPRLRRYPVPVAAPPLVGEPGAVVSVLTHLSPDQGVLELELPQRPRAAAAAPDLPEVGGWTRGYLVVLLEVLSGHRPPQQLLRWSSADVYTDVQRRAVLSARLRGAAAGPGPRPRVLRVLPCALDDGTVEVSAVVRAGDRVRALALRVERRHERWRVTALEVG